MSQLDGETSPLERESTVVGKIHPLAWSVSEGHLTVVKILICHLAVGICTRNLSSTSKIFHRAVVACASTNRDSQRRKIVRLLIEGGVQTFDELLDAIQQNDPARLEVLVTFGDLAMPTRKMSLLKLDDAVFNNEFLNHPHAVSEEVGLISTFFNEVRSKLTEKREFREDLELKKQLTSATSIISDGMMFSQSSASRGDLELKQLLTSATSIISDGMMSSQWPESRARLELEELMTSATPIISDGMISPQWSLFYRRQAPESDFNENLLRHTSIYDLSHLLRCYQTARDLAKYGQYDEAITMYTSVLEYLKIQGEQGSHDALSMGCIKNMEAAETALKVETERAALDSGLREVSCWHYTAHTLASQGRHREALLVYEEVLAGLHKLHGDYDYEILSCSQNIAISLGEVGCLKKMKELQSLVFKICLLRYGGYHPITAGSLRNLAITLCQEGNFILAESCFTWAAALFIYALGAKSHAAMLCVNDWKRMQWYPWSLSSSL
jgi:tetratricopeptide (TPR) repeat protein